MRVSAADWAHIETVFRAWDGCGRPGDFLAFAHRRRLRPDHPAMRIAMTIDQSLYPERGGHAVRRIPAPDGEDRVVVLHTEPSGRRRQQIYSREEARAVAEALLDAVYRP